MTLDQASPLPLLAQSGHRSDIPKCPLMTNGPAPGARGIDTGERKCPALSQASPLIGL